MNFLYPEATKCPFHGDTTCTYEDEILPLLLCINDFSLLGSRFSVDGLYNSRGYTPIHEACSGGHLDVLKFFFAEVRLNLNLPSLLQCVPSLLGIACKLNHCNVIDYMHSLCATGIRTPMAMVFKEDATNKWTSAFVNHCNACIDNLGNFTDQWGVSRKIEGESSLIFAVRNANKILFEHICKKRPDFSCANSNGDTLLHAACPSYDLKMLEDVWKLCEWTNKKNEQGNTCFHLACEWGSLKIVEFLIDKSFMVDEINCRGETPFHLSIIYEQFPIFERLLNMRNSSNFINAATNNGETPLHLAACDRKLFKYVQHILAHKKFNSINIADNLGNTPLFNACYTRKKDLICLIMEYEGCDILHVNKHGETVFNVALRMNMSNLFFEKLAKSTPGVYPLKLQNGLGQTLLHIACSTGDLQTVKYLNDQELYAMSEDINLMDKVNELTPLQYACMESNKELCNLLLKVTDCDPDTKNKEGDTALHICSKHNLVQMAKLCKELSSITVRNELGDTPLHVACKYGNYELARYLLEGSHGKQLDDYYAKGDTVLHVAAGKEGAVEVMKTIIGKRVCDYKAKNVINGLTALHIAFSEGILENAEYLLSLHPQKDENSWYTNDYRSPLCYAVESRCYNFLQSFTRSADSWFLENCIKVRHPFDNLLREEFVIMPLPHYLLYTVIVTHKDAQSQLYQEGHMRAVQGSHSSKCALLGDFLSSFLDDRAYKMYDSHECSLLHYFALCNCEYLDPLVDKILQNCKIDHPDKNRQLPLHFACYKENELVIFKILEQQNAHELLHCKNLSELAPPDMCSKYSNDCTSFLLSWGAEIEFPPPPPPPA